MESYGGDAGCADCHREHCRQRQAPPSAVRVPTATASAPDHRRRQQQQQHQKQQPRRQQQSSQRRGGRSSFIAGSFVIGLILVPCAMSAPVKPHQSQPQPHDQRQHNQQQQQQRRHQTDPAMMPTGTPFWHNPCGMQLAAFDGSGGGGGGAGFDGGGGGGGGGGGHDVMMMESEAMRREEDVIPSVVMSANQALIHVEQFAGSFVVETFRMDVKPLHSLWKSTTITWLQQFKYMPKELDEPLDSSYLASLTFREVLLATYVGMQNLAVGLEQVAWDQERERLSFAKDFKETTFKLRAVLCEISAAIYETTEANSDKSEVYVSRDIMPLQSRLDNRPLRDWLILREYITGLQYVIEAFEHFKSPADR